LELSSADRFFWATFFFLEACLRFDLWHWCTELPDDNDDEALYVFSFPFLSF
jgi:hypothetical protein